MSQLLEQFKKYIQNHWLFDPQSRLIVAVSGGLDSVVLVKLLHSAGYTFAIAHCDFGLRGAESDGDAAFVRQMANAYNAAFFVRHFDTEVFAEEHKLSIQEAARKLRYDWFAGLVKSQWQEPNNHLAGGQKSLGSKGQNAYLLTAHHADDNIETVLMNFFKGTGISGVRGMLPKVAHVVRPLLFARRSDLEQFAAEQKLQWVEDSSNASIKYTRNFFRHEVLPLVAKKFPQALENIAANIGRFAETEMLYQQAIERYRKNLLQVRGDEVFIPVLKLQGSKPLLTIAFELLKPYGFSVAQTPDVLHLLSSDSGRFVTSATHRVVRHRKWLVIAPIQSAEASLVVIEKDEHTVLFGKQQMQLAEKPVPRNLFTEQNTALLDAHLLQFPMVLRRWKKGDYFYPLGMRKKKKVSRLLIDEKLSSIQKENTWVLESGKKIVWVVGLRIDDRFKVTGETRSIYQLTTSLLSADNPAHRR